MNAVDVHDVWKYYGDFPALRDIKLQRRARLDCVALLGRNGAGKTTLLRIIAGLSKPREGCVTCSDRTCAIKQRAAASACLATASRVYDELSALENLTLFARLYGLADPEADAARMAGTHRPRPRVATAWCANFRAACASVWRWRARSCTIPKSLLLDEPFTALDDRAIAVLQSLLARCARARAHHRHVHAPAARGAGTGHARRADPARASWPSRGERTQEMLDDTGWLYRTYGEA